MTRQFLSRWQLFLHFQSLPTLIKSQQLLKVCERIDVQNFPNPSYETDIIASVGLCRARGAVMVIVRGPGEAPEGREVAGDER